MGWALESMFRPKEGAALPPRLPGPPGWAWRGGGDFRGFSFRSGTACILLALPGHRPETRSQHLRSNPQPVRDRCWWKHRAGSALWWANPGLFTHSLREWVNKRPRPTKVCRTLSLAHTLLAFLFPLPHVYTHYAFWGHLTDNLYQNPLHESALGENPR